MLTALYAEDTTIREYKNVMVILVVRSYSEINHCCCMPRKIELFRFLSKINRLQFFTCLKYWQNSQYTYSRETFTSERIPLYI